MSASEPIASGVEAGALALQRVLALEGRNALARVELAASELGRFELSPTVQDRVTAIREAVGELDGLLDKIERLSNPAGREASREQSNLGQVLVPLLQRIAPALAARGIALDEANHWVDTPLAMPASALERLLLLWLRIAIASFDEESDESARGGTRLSLESREQADAVELRLRFERSGSGVRWCIDRAQRVELDVALAEWQGRARHSIGDEVSRLELSLPRSVLHA